MNKQIKVVNEEKKECFACGDELGTINFHIIFTDGEEFDACPSCAGVYFNEIPEEIKSVIRIGGM